MTQKAIAELFDVNVPAISKHIKNIFDDGELSSEATVSILEIVQKEGEREVNCSLEFYKLDMIIAILAGTSGTGKSKLARLFAEAIGATSENGRFKLIAVRPDWSDSTDLLGYRDLNGKFNKGVLTSVIIDAIDTPDKSFLVCLDEMNLARVEYYLSDILSIIESRKWNNERIVTDQLIDEECIERRSCKESIYFKIL